ncbi:cytochrome c oxidase subunit II [Teichococcus aestuarii]|uniref:cytochrome c oxidase subunit II n=1 Tax=Teichococcus aestuarii TaxID=568898 RepID=UPI00360906C1
MDRVAGDGHLRADALAGEFGDRVGHAVRAPLAGYGVSRGRVAAVSDGGRREFQRAAPEWFRRAAPSLLGRAAPALSRRAAPGAALLLAGCSGPLSTLDPAGPGAASVATLWWVMFFVATAILLGVCAVALYTLRRERRGRGLHVGRFVAGWGVAFPVTALAVLLVIALRTGEGMLPKPGPEGALRVAARGQQWWWSFTQWDAAGNPVHSAGELHIPAGRAVDVHITAADVIHSFWVPRLTGKLDAIPGHENVLRLRADAPGIYEGQCAEFCGLQHAQMDFRVIAHPPEAYAAALAALATARPDPAHPGAADFAANCASCHGTDARAESAAPNLAGLAQRGRIGGGTLRNEGQESVLLWLRRHETLKPGSREPSHAALDDATLARIAGYLETAR